MAELRIAAPVIPNCEASRGGRIVKAVAATAGAAAIAVGLSACGDTVGPVPTLHTSADASLLATAGHQKDAFAALQKCETAGNPYAVKVSFKGGKFFSPSGGDVSSLGPSQASHDQAAYDAAAAKFVTDCYQKAGANLDATWTRDEPKDPGSNATQAQKDAYTALLKQFKQDEKSMQQSDSAWSDASSASQDGINNAYAGRTSDAKTVLSQVDAGYQKDDLTKNRLEYVKGDINNAIGDYGSRSYYGNGYQTEGTGVRGLIQRTSERDCLLTAIHELDAGYKTVNLGYDCPAFTADSSGYIPEQALINKAAEERGAIANDAVNLMGTERSLGNELANEGVTNTLPTYIGNEVNAYGGPYWLPYASDEAKASFATNVESPAAQEKGYMQSAVDQTQARQNQATNDQNAIANQTVSNLEKGISVTHS